MRSRNIKPGFFTNEMLGTYDPIVSLLFAGLWCLADRDGILEDRPLRIKAELFPYREKVDINGYVTVLERDGFVTRYEVDGKRYIIIENFTKHQSPHNTEKPKGFPRPTEETQGLRCKDSLTPLSNGEVTVPKRPDSLIPDSLIPDSPSEKSDELFARFWAAYPKKKSKGAAMKAWGKIKAKQETLVLILSALGWQTQTSEWKKEGGQYIPHPASYLNSMGWMDERPESEKPKPFLTEAEYLERRKAELKAAREAYMIQEESILVPLGAKP